MRIKPYKPRNLEDFWTTRVEGWLLGGVESCVKKNINIGATTLIFCYIDFFGSLIHPNPEASSRNRFYLFCEKYLYISPKSSVIILQLTVSTNK